MLSDEEFKAQMDLIRRRKNRNRNIIVIAVLILVGISFLITRKDEIKEIKTSGSYTEKEAYDFVVNYGKNGYTIGNQIDALVGFMRDQGNICQVVEGKAEHLGNDIFSVSCIVIVNNDERYYYSWKADLNRKHVIPDSEFAKKLVYPK